MNHLINNQQKLNNIIFANRNKAYGAYAIRSSYGETVLKALGMMIFSVGILCAAAFYYTRSSLSITVLDIPKIIDSVYVIPVNFPPEEIKKPETISSPSFSKPNSAIISSNIIDSTQIEHTDTSSVLDLALATSTATSETSLTVSDASLTGTSSHTNQNIGKKSDEVKGLLEVDTQPEFEGGLAALNRFIALNLRYPKPASEAGQQGKVYVQFIVDENGKVGDLFLLNSIGYGMDEEALRVVALIPKFKTPAKVKGQAVKTYFQVPIRFKYQ